MIVKQYDTVLLKNGQEAAIVEILSSTNFIADVGDSPENWDTIDITLDDVKKVICRSEA